MMLAHAGRAMPVVLVVDDDEMQRFLCREALESAGCEIVEASDTDFISKPINWALLPHRVRYALRADEMLIALEIARDQAQAADAAKTAFLAAMSHEFRTPLNAIIGFAEIIAKEAFGQIANERYLDASRSILNAGER